MSTENPLFKTVNTTIEVSVRLLVFFLLVAWCLMIVLPFLTPILWGLILAVALTPFYNSINSRIRRSGISATLVALLVLAVLAVPAVLFLSSIIRGFHDVGVSMREGTLYIPAPDPRIENWPFVGDEITDIWSLGHSNMSEAVKKYSEHLSAVGAWMVRAVKNVGLSVAYFVLAVLIAAVLLATKHTEEVSSIFYKKLVGEQGEELKKLTVITIQKVTKGILGVAFIQATYLGLVFVLAGIPHAGIWALLCFVLATVQIGPFLVVIPLIIYSFSVMDTTPAVLWSIAMFAGTLVDNILKPILIGKGAPVPMLVIFIGAIGGFLLSGFIGLFTGAIVFSLGYTLFKAWLFEDLDPETLHSKLPQKASES